MTLDPKKLEIIRQDFEIKYANLAPALDTSRDGDGDYENATTRRLYGAFEFGYKAGIWGAATEINNNLIDQVASLEARAARLTEERDATILSMAHWSEKHWRLQEDFDNLKAESEARSAGKLIIVPPVENAPEVTITIGGLGLVVTDPLAPMFAEEVQKLKASVVEAKDKLRNVAALSDNYGRALMEIRLLKAELSRFQWRPIEEAPKDGTEILAVISGNHPTSGRPFISSVVEFDEYLDCFIEEGHDPDDDYDIWHCKEWSDKLTHFMPLPAPPTTINPSDSAPRPESRLPAEDNTEKLVQTIAEEVTAWQRGSRATLGRHIKRALMGEGMHGASSAAYLGNEPTTDTAGSIPASPDLTAALKGSV